MSKKGIFILGMHRSGTSALSGVLNILGLELGDDLMKKDEYNPKGYFENNRIFLFNEKILNSVGSSWSDETFNIDSISKSQFDNYVKEAKEIIEDEFRYVKNFLIKDPRISILFPIWERATLDLGYEIKTVIAYRNPLEVAKSLKRRDNFNFEKSILLWAKHTLDAEYFSRKYDRASIIFDDLLDNPNRVVNDLAKLLDIDINEKKQKYISSFLDKSIKHNNIDIKNFSKEVPLFLRELIDIIIKRDFDNRDKFNSIRDEFLYSIKFFYNRNYKKEIVEKRELELKVEELRDENTLLERIKDIDRFDKKFYIAEYPDLINYDGDLLEHYIYQGSKEGRFPNAYSKKHNIDSRGRYPLEYKIEKLKKEYRELKGRLNIISAEKEKISEDKLSLERKISELEENYLLLQTRLSELESEKEKILEDKLSLERKISELESEKEKILEDKLSLERKISELESEKKRISEDKLSLKNRVSNLNSDYQRLELEKDNLEKLNSEIIKDLIKIKNSRSYRFTKVFRDINRVFKRVKDGGKR